MQIQLTNSRTTAAALLLTIAMLPAGVIADTQNSSADTEIKSYLTADTAVVGWIDLTQIDLAAVKKFCETADLPVQDLPRLRPMQEVLTELGVRRIYWVTDLAGLFKGPQAVIVPVPQDKADSISLVLDAVARQHGGTTVTAGDCLLVGQTQEVERLQQNSSAQDADLQSTLAEVTGPHALFIRTGESALLPLATVLPELLGQQTELVVKAVEVLGSVRAVTAVAQLPPAEFRVTVTTESDDSAAAAANLINEFLGNELQEAAEPLTVAARGSDVMLTSEEMTKTVSMISSVKKLMAPARQRNRRMSTMKSLQQIALAMHNFHATYGHFPAHALADGQGKRLLSWRVLILPFLGEQALYDEFRLDEPWDSPHNRELIARTPSVYQGSSTDEQALQSGKTRLTTPLTARSVFGRSGKAVGIADMIDGTSNTLLVVEAAPDQTFVWTQPQDVVIPQQQPLNVLVDKAAKGFHAAMGDGLVLLIPESIEEQTLHSLLTFDGRETIDRDKW